MRISSPEAALVFTSSGNTSTAKTFPPLSTSRTAFGAPDSVRPEPMAIFSIICRKSETFDPSTESILSPGMSPAFCAGDSTVFPSAPVMVFETYPTTVVVSKSLDGTPKIQTKTARTAASSTLKSAPAALTIILSRHDAFGRFFASVPSVPSSAPKSASCGMATYPPSGRALKTYSQPSFPLRENSIGPNPTENLSTFSPRSFAARKCPSSWINIEPPKNSNTRTVAQALENMSGSEAIFTGRRPPLFRTPARGPARRRRGCRRGFAGLWRPPIRGFCRRRPLFLSTAICPR